MADPSAQAPKRVHLHPLQLQAGPPLWLLNAPGVSGVYVKGAEAQYGVEFLGGIAGVKAAAILQLDVGARLPVSYVELGSADPAMADALEAAVRGALCLTRERGAWGRAHVHGDRSQAPSLGSVVSVNLWTSPAFAEAEANVELGDGPRVALGLGVDGAIHVGVSGSRCGWGARGRRRRVSLM